MIFVAQLFKKCTEIRKDDRKDDMTNLPFGYGHKLNKPWRPYP